MVGPMMRPQSLWHAVHETGEKAVRPSWHLPQARPALMSAMLNCVAPAFWANGLGWHEAQLYFGVCEVWRKLTPWKAMVLRPILAWQVVQLDTAVVENACLPSWHLPHDWPAAMAFMV